MNRCRLCHNPIYNAEQWQTYNGKAKDKPITFNAHKNCHAIVAVRQMMSR